MYICVPTQAAPQSRAGHRSEPEVSQVFDGHADTLGLWRSAAVIQEERMYIKALDQFVILDDVHYFCHKRRTKLAFGKCL